MEARVGIIKTGDHKGSIVRESIGMIECPRFEALDGSTIVIVDVIANGEVGRIFAVKDSQVRWS